MNRILKGMPYRLLKYALTLILVLTAQQSFSARSTANGLLFNVSVTGSILTISTTITNHFYPEAGIKLRTPGYTIASAGSTCTLNSNGYCLFSVSQTQPQTITLAGGTGEVQIILCLNGKGPLSCQNYTVNVSAPPPPVAYSYAYISNINAGVGDAAVVKCSVDNTTGNLSNCADATGGLLSPFGLAANPDNSLLYVTQLANGNITRCAITPVTGDLTACNTAVDLGGGVVPTSLAFNSANTLAYISTLNGPVLLCNVQASTGNLIGCGNTEVFTQADNIILNAADTRAYVTNGATSTIFKCDINQGNGELENCVDSQATLLTSPIATTFNNDETIAYTSNVPDNTITQCDINAISGDLENCVISSADGLAAPGRVALNSQGSVSYIPNILSNVVRQCTVGPGGDLTPCVDANINPALLAGPGYVLVITLFG